MFNKEGVIATGILVAIYWYLGQESMLRIVIIISPFLGLGASYLAIKVERWLTRNKSPLL